jgi:hypothetical protein
VNWVSATFSPLAIIHAPTSLIRYLPESRTAFPANNGAMHDKTMFG